MKEYVAKSVRPDMVTLVEPPGSSAIRKDVKVLPASLNDLLAADWGRMAVRTGDSSARFGTSFPGPVRGRLETFQRGNPTCVQARISLRICQARTSLDNFV